MIIVGVDPGFATVGYGVIESKGSRHRECASGAIRTSSKMAFDQRLLCIYDELMTVFQLHQPQAIAIEALFFNTNVTTAIKVAQARGVAVLAAAKCGVNIFDYTPLQVKTSVCGYGRADKQQVQRTVKMLLKLATVPKPDDVADALAIAICHAHSHRLNSYV